jgi:5-methylcytosine-specific restriction protein A
MTITAMQAALMSGCKGLSSNREIEMRKIATLQPRIKPLGDPKRVRKVPFGRTEFSANRAISGSARQKRAARIKLAAKYRCACCGRITMALEIDHRIPLSQGGSDDESNLQPLCCDGPLSCHRVKSQLEATFQTVSNREILARQKAARDE